MLKAKIVTSYVSNDFCGPEPENVDDFAERVSRINPGLKPAKRLSIYSLDSSRPSILEEELAAAGFESSDSVVIKMDPDACCRECGISLEYGCEHRRRMPQTHSQPLTFGELEVGDRFIAFPTDGDDSGHGGFRVGYFLYRKESENFDATNAVGVWDGCRMSATRTMRVLRILM